MRLFLARPLARNYRKNLSATETNYGSLDTDKAVVVLANASWLLHRVAAEVRPLATPPQTPAGNAENPPEVAVTVGGNITVEEANKTAMELAKQDHKFVDGGARDWAAAIRKATGKTCSVATVENTRLWKETMKATGRGRTKGKTPKAVALTDNMKSVVGEGERHEVLQELIAQHGADYEPSPLDNDTPNSRRKTTHYKRL